MSNAAPKVRAVREDLLIGDLENLDDVSLGGSRCAACNETSLGVVQLCPNCGSDRISALRLSNRGALWTYSVARHRPPGNYRGPEPFAPFGIGLVELPEGLRVMATLAGDVDTLHVGMPLEFTPYARHDEDGAVVVAFTYALVQDQRS